MMKKIYEAPEVCKIEFDVEEALMASVIQAPSGEGTEIGDKIVDLW